MSPSHMNRVIELKEDEFELAQNAKRFEMICLSFNAFNISYHAIVVVSTLSTHLL